jgi:hypothetical protein
MVEPGHLLGRKQPGVRVVFVSCGLGLRHECCDQAAQYCLENLQRQICSSQTIRRARECTTSQEGNVFERGVTVKHLNDEPMDGRDRCQETQLRQRWPA